MQRLRNIITEQVPAVCGLRQQEKEAFWKEKQTKMAWLDFWIPFINRKNQNSWKCHKCNYKIVAEVPPQKCPRCGTENPAVYYCDPEKNTSCSKESCYLHGGPCRLTLKPEAAREDREHPEDFE